MESDLTIVLEDELRRVISTDLEAISTAEESFRWCAAGRVVSPPVMHIAVEEHHGDVDVKSAYVKGESHFAIKIGSGYFNNPRLGLPSSSAQVVLIDSRTGRASMIFLDNGYLTDVRTAAAGAVAVRHLARSSDAKLGIIGSGAQARYQLRAIAAERRLGEVRVAARSPEKAASYVEEMSRELSLPIRTASIEEVLATSDVVVTTTPASTPIVPGELVREGQTIIAMGSDAPHKRELDTVVLNKAALIVCDSRSQCEVLGELHHALTEGGLRSDATIVELGDVIAGKAPGRRADREIIVCDLTGLGVQDTAIGLHARRRVLESGLGRRASAQI